ncbi:hypothetical protein CSC17_1747 [Klebsiella oxytoca]|jgi:hypothetical protein|nr:hypothetical protein CSC17_1747 [Klebsiella oxytoca]
MVKIAIDALLISFTFVTTAVSKQASIYDFCPLVTKINRREA